MTTDIEMTDASPPPTLSTSTIPPSLDLGNLLLTSSTPIPPNPSEAQLASIAQQHAQTLITTLLTTRPIHLSPHDKSTLLLSLPPTTTPLPREKPLPKPKGKTKWEAFAEKKGIGGKKKGTEGGRVWDEEKKEWVKGWGYKGPNRNGKAEGGVEDDWLVEVEDKGREEKDGLEGKSVRGLGRREKRERVRRQERKERANEARGRKGKGGD